MPSQSNEPVGLTVRALEGAGGSQRSRFRIASQVVIAVFYQRRDHRARKSGVTANSIAVSRVDIPRSSPLSNLRSRREWAAESISYISSSSALVLLR